MKKILLVMMAVAGLGFSSKAQNFGFHKGDVLLEGTVNVNGNDNKNSEVRSTSFTLSPKAGYFISDKAALGIQLSYGRHKTTSYSGTNDSYTLTNSAGFGVFGRYYLLNAGSRFKAYGEADLGYTTSGGKNSNGATTVKMNRNNTIGVNAGLGANFFLTERIAIGYQFVNLIGFNSSKMNTDNAKAINSFYLNLNSFQNFFSTGQFSLTFKF